MIVEKSRRESAKAFFGRFTKFGWAALALVLAFFLIGACTAGGLSDPGKSYRAAADSQVVFYLDYQTRGDSGTSPLDKIYMNAGNMFAEVGSDQTFAFRRASASGSSAPTFSSTGLGNVTVGNVYSASGKGASGANHNWVKLFDMTENGTDFSTTYRLIRVTFPCDMYVNEIVFVDKSGEVIPAYVHENDVRGFFGDRWSSYRELFSSETRRPEAVNLLDKQELAFGRTPYTQFTQDEIYTLMQIQNIRMGSATTDGVFNADMQSGPLSVLFPYLGTLIFGASPFGLRIFPLLFTAALVALAYFFGKELFGKEGFGFLFACLFAAGGLALTVGRLGLAIPAFAFFTALSYYFMFRFFSKGIDELHPVRSALNVLLSGLMFALAFAADPKCVFAVIGLAALFVCGAVRYARSYRAEREALRGEMLERNRKEPSEEVMRENIAECEEQTAVLRADYVYGSKLIYLFFFISFVVGTALLTVLAMLPSYHTYVKLYDPNPSSPSAGLFNLLFAALGDSFTAVNATLYSAANASSSFGWLIALKGATLFSAHTDGTYIALNAQSNLAITVTALVGFVFSAAYAVLYAVTGGQKGAYASEHSSRILRAWALLTAGTVTSLLQFAFGNGSVANSLLFNFFYTGYVPLLFYTAYVHDGSAVKKVLGMPMNSTLKVLFGMCILYVVLFGLSLPMYFGIPMAPGAAMACFGWTTFISNGFYRPAAAQGQAAALGRALAGRLIRI